MIKLKDWFIGSTTGGLLARVGVSIVAALVIGNLVANLLWFALKGSGLPFWLAAVIALVVCGITGNRIGAWVMRIGQARRIRRAPRQFTEDDL